LDYSLQFLSRRSPKNWLKLEPKYRKCVSSSKIEEEVIMGFGRGALLWLLGVPLPIILLLALFWHH
jgi:hypothetical protein